MFLQNKYTSWYYNIINSAKSSIPVGYTETHHIIPKCLGGSNESSNLVRLSARQHFICHLLLTKMLKGPERYKMAFALNRMLTSSKTHNRYTPSSKIYELSRKLRSEAISSVHKNIPESAESNLKRSVKQKGVPKGPKTEEHKRNLSISKKGKPSKRKGVPTGTKGLTYEEIYGPNTAARLKELRTIQFKGRKFSEKTKATWSKNRKGKTCGSKNSNATPVIINGVHYACKKYAQVDLGITLYELNKLLKTNSS